MFKKAEGEEAVRITELSSPIKISFEIPEELINKDSKIKRTYTMYLLYNDEVMPVEVTVDGNIATFETDKFSTYVLAYKDAESTDNPNTGENIIPYFIMLIVSLSGLIGIGLYSKSKNL